MEQLKFSFFAPDHQKFYMADLVCPVQRSSLHTHDFYEFFVILDGCFYEEWNGQTLQMSEGMAQIVRPCDQHGFHATRANQPARLRNIAVDAAFFENELLASGVVSEERLADLPAFSSFRMNREARRIYLEKTDALFENNPEKLKEYLFKNILSDFLLLYRSERRKENIPAWLEETCAEMEKQENFQAGLPRMIELCEKSQEHLTRCLKEYYGKTPTEFINQLRLQAAAALLQNSQLKIIDIMFECGFNNIPYFNRLFKEHYGMPPRAYRERSRRMF